MFQSMPDRAKTSPLPVREAQGQPLVLVVEDEAALVTLLRYNLEREGFRVIDAANGEEALLIVKEQRPDLILLDWMLPALSGIEVCRQIRRSPEHRRTPIIMLTARGEESERVRGLATGADDYIVKPFSVPELLARVKGLLRRASPERLATVLTYGDIELDREKRRVARSGRPIDLGPTEYRLLVKQDLKRWSLPRLRHCTGAGEPLNPEVIHAWHDALGLMIHDGYGQTETILLAANLPALPIRPGSMGKPFPGHELRVIGEDGAEPAPGEVGDLALRGRPPSLFLEYWKSPEETAACWRGEWYLTGDRARRDEDGYLWFVGRADDLIISAGYRIGPFEVESALIEHPAVAEAGVIGKPDPVAMEIVKAFVALKDGHEPTDQLRRELIGFAREKLGAGVAPREIDFIAALPKTRSGKIMRRLLRDVAEGRALGDTTTLADPTVVAELKSRYEDKEG